MKIQLYHVHLISTESLPLIIVLSAVIGGIILTVAVIVIMILCRRSSSLSLKNIKNQDSGPILTHQKTENDYGGSNKLNSTKTANNKSGAKFKRNAERIDGLNGNSPLSKPNGNGFDLGSNHPLISNEDGPGDEQVQKRMAAGNWNGGGDGSIIDNQQFNRSNNGDYHEFSDNQVFDVIIYIVTSCVKQ